MKLEPHTRSVELFRHDPSDSGSLGSNFVHSIYEDNARRIWVGSGNEIACWDSVTRTFRRYTNAEFSRSLFANIIGADHRGRLWIKYEGEGMGVLDPSEGMFTIVA